MLDRRDLERAVDGQRADLHGAAEPAGVQQPHQVLAVAALQQRPGQLARLLVGDEPGRQAASSTQPIFRPCRSSITRTYSEACTIDWNVPVSSQAVPRSSTVTSSPPARRYSSLTPVISSSPRVAGLQLAGDPDHVGVVEVQARHDVAWTWGGSGFSSIESTLPSSSNSTTP